MRRPGAGFGWLERAREVGDERGEALGGRGVALECTHAPLGDLVLGAVARELAPELFEHPGESVVPLVGTSDDARFAREDVPTGRRDRTAFGRVADRPGREPGGDLVAREVVLGELERAEQHACRDAVGETTRRRAVPRDPRRFEDLGDDARVRLVDAVQHGHLVERRAALGPLDDPARDGAGLVFGVGGAQERGAGAQRLGVGLLSRGVHDRGAPRRHGAPPPARPGPA